MVRETYRVTSPSNVARSNLPRDVTPMSCAVLRMRRMSLKEGGTNRLDEMKRFLSWYLNAASSGSLVKKVPILGTRSFSLDCPSVPTFWCSTKMLVSPKISAKGVQTKLTVIVNHMLNIQHDLCISPVSHFSHLLHILAPRLKDTGRL